MGRCAGGVRQRLRSLRDRPRRGGVTQFDGRSGRDARPVRGDSRIRVRPSQSAGCRQAFGRRTLPASRCAGRKAWGRHRRKRQGPWRCGEPDRRWCGGSGIGGWHGRHLRRYGVGGDLQRRRTATAIFRTGRHCRHAGGLFVQWRQAGGKARHRGCGLCGHLATRLRQLLRHFACGVARCRHRRTDARGCQWPGERDPCRAAGRHGQ